MIRFTEPRTLAIGGEVQAGEERSFDPAEEVAFVANGVAEYVTTPAAGKTKKEVTDNG